MKFTSFFKFIFGFVLFAFGYSLNAQQPTITSISPRSSSAGTEVIIQGNGFSNNSNELMVRFGAAEAAITLANINLLVVNTPPGSTFQSVSVTNLNSGLTGYSQFPFLLSYSGNNFDENAVSVPYDYASENELYDLSLNDFDGDGRTDIITANNNSNLVTVYQNTSTVGTIGFTKKFITINSNTLNVNSRDLNGDGKPDAVISKSGNPGDRIYILKNTSVIGNITFDTPDFLIVDGNIARRIEIQDLDNDGLPEIIVTNQGSPNISIFKNSSTPTTISFEPLTTVEIIDANVADIHSSGLAVEDLNGDGFPEIMCNQFLEKNVYIIPNLSQVGLLQFGPTQILDVPGNIINIIVGDINLDDKPDIVVSKLQQNQIAILPNNGSGSTISFGTEQLYTVNDRPWGLDLGDVDGDGKVDIIAGSINYGDRKISILENQSSGGTLNLFVKYVPTPEITRNLKLGDIDTDGKPDFVLTSIETFNITILRNENCYKPLLSPPGPLSICTDTEINVEATKGIDIVYQWDKDNVVFKTGSEDTIIINTPGVYKVIATSESGNCVQVSNAIIANAGSGSVPTNPVIYNNGPFCQGENIELSTDNVAGGLFYWDGPDGFTSTSQNVTIANASVLMAGQYNLQVTVGDCSSDISSTIVGVTTLPTFTIIPSGPTSFCEGDNVRLSVSSIAGYTYQWYNNNALIPGATNYYYDAIIAGSYTVEITQTSSLCTTIGSNFIDISVIAQPVASFTYEGLECENAAIQFTNTSTYEFGESVGFSWDFGDGSFIVNNENPEHTYIASGTFTIAFSVAYTSGACRDTVFTLITIDPTPVFEILKTPDEIVCDGEDVSLTTSVAFDNYQWSTGEITQSIVVQRPANYSVIASNVNGCPGEQSLNLIMNEKPSVSASADPIDVEAESIVQLSASGALNYSWTPADLLDDPNISNPEAVVTETTEFTVIGINADGCTDSASVIVNVYESNIIKVDPKNLFSPNGDGIDDYWVIENIENYPGNSIVIYNGNGSVVYENNNYNNEWDAVYNGKNLPETAYFFVIRYENKEPKTGSVTVIR